MSSNEGGASQIPDATLPLPPNPNLEFEKKRAKQILRDVHRGDVELLERLRQHSHVTNASGARLSDVQFTIAREYGFASWPKLVEYYRTLRRHENAGPHRNSYQPDTYEFRVKHLMAHHARRQSHAAQTLSAFVPRFYGRTDEEIFAKALSEAEARLAIARMERCPNWDALIEAGDRDRRQFDWTASEPDMKVRRERAYGVDFANAQRAVDESDVATLSDLIDANPELVLREQVRSGPGSMLLRHALDIEIKTRDESAKTVSDFLVSRGADLVTVASGMLLMGIQVDPGKVQFLIDRGADPNWITPGGFPILEWAIMRYWSSAAVDILARRAQRRSAFWIAAGLGDVKDVVLYLDSSGKPTDAARRDRPDFLLVDLPMPCRPDADDLEILWEAFMIAGFNERLNVIDALLERGFPIDYDRWGSTLLSWAQGNRKTVLAEHLLKRGARSPTD